MVVEAVSETMLDSFQSELAEVGIGKQLLSMMFSDVLTWVFKLG